MADRAYLAIAARTIPAGRRFHPRDAATTGLEAPVHRFSMRSAMSAIDTIEVEVLHDDPNLELEPLLWRAAAVDLHPHEVEHPLLRWGLVEEIEYAGGHADRHRYRVLLRPPVNRLSYRTDTRIFRRLSSVEIVREVIAGAGQRVEERLRTDYSLRDYTVQYRETDLDFVQRLLVEDGIFFWLEHDDEGDRLVLADDAGAHRPLPRTPILRFVTAGVPDEAELSELRFTTRIVPDEYVATDWNWLTPNAPVEGIHSTGASRLARHEHPARVGDADQARRAAERRHQAYCVPKYELEGLARSLAIEPGSTFALVGARPSRLDGDYLVASVDTSLDEVGSDTGTRVRLKALPTSVPFRALPRTPRPRVDARESAVTTGPSGEEIHVDAFGQVKIRPYWEREGVTDEGSSCWVRTTQPSTAGSMFLPRVGWEVAVGYIDGDPDRPIVTHKLYDSRQPPPYELPDASSRSTWRSLSSPGGDGDNEVRFDDEPGLMELYVHAQKDLQVAVGNDRHEQVGVMSVERAEGRLSQSVGGLEAITVGLDQHVQVDASLTARTGALRQVDVVETDDLRVGEGLARRNDGARLETVVGTSVQLANDIDHIVHGQRTHRIGGAFITAVSGPFVEAVGANKTERVDGARVSLVGGAFVADVGGTRTSSAAVLSITTAGPLATRAADAVLRVSGDASHEVSEALGASGATVSLTGRTELRARASGSELHLSGSVLDVDARVLSGQGARVRLMGQVEMIGAGSADEAEPEAPSSEDDWIEVTLVDADGSPLADEEYVVRLADGSERRGRTSGQGRAREEGVPPGVALWSFPSLAQSGEGES